MYARLKQGMRTRGTMYLLPKRRWCYMVLAVVSMATIAITSAAEDKKSSWSLAAMVSRNIFMLKIHVVIRMHTASV